MEISAVSASHNEGGTVPIWRGFILHPQLCCQLMSLGILKQNYCRFWFILLLCGEGLCCVYIFVGFALYSVRCLRFGMFHCSEGRVSQSPL